MQGSLGISGNVPGLKDPGIKRGIGVKGCKGSHGLGTEAKGYSPVGFRVCPRPGYLLRLYSMVHVLFKSLERNTRAVV